MLGAHRLPASSRTRRARAPTPQPHRAPQPYASRRPAASHGAEAPAGMALAKVLDSANAPGGFPRQLGRPGRVRGVPYPHLCPPPHGGRQVGGRQSTDLATATRQAEGECMQVKTRVREW